ncbi:MAG: ATP-binding cassette domain-containing protein [Brumimicrobium sp.]|nr:ATP-binding cassette domain-containing protein [Brumimicrobium sp.]
MDIHFSQVIPSPLVDQPRQDASLWGKDFTLKHGENICLSAQSGKGKTSFVHILLGIRKDYTGKVSIGGKDIRDFTYSDWINLRKNQISCIFQDLQLFPKLTVAENLLLKNELTHTFSMDEIKQMVSELGIENKWDSICEQLSFGQQQRVAIIRALCQPFEWLILDEPFSHLDTENILKASSLIKKVVEAQQAGIILTSLGDLHDFHSDKTIYL